jgi:chemosensory pili system protein ChpA (sensor histidine kinase/response regulator)
VCAWAQGNLQIAYRLMRQTAKELDKKANLEFRGTRVEIDRSVLEKITAPFEHLLRNAVAHGLEMPTERLARGKPEIGEISIDAQQVGNEVVLTLADDGAGLNFARIREKAIEKGIWMRPPRSTRHSGSNAPDSPPPKPSPRSAAAWAWMWCATKSFRRTDIAYDATMTGGGCGRRISGAVPSDDRNQLQCNKAVPALMEALLGGKPAVSAQRKAAVILAKSGQQRAAVQVDSIIGNREVVVKTIGPQLARLAGVAGATMTGSGQIVLIMNPVQLVFRETATVSVEKSSEGVAPEMQSAASASEATVEVLPEGRWWSEGTPPPHPKHRTRWCCSRW